MRTDLMSFFKKLKANMIINKKNEQTFYELAIREIATGQKRTGLWAIALSKSDGSLDKAHALYIGLLAEEIKNDEYLEASKIENEQRIAKLIESEREKEFNRVKKIVENLKKEQEKEKKKLIDPRFKEEQPFLKKEH